MHAGVEFHECCKTIVSDLLSVHADDQYLLFLASRWQGTSCHYFHSNDCYTIILASLRILSYQIVHVPLIPIIGSWSRRESPVNRLTNAISCPTLNLHLSANSHTISTPWRYAACEECLLKTHSIAQNQPSTHHMCGCLSVWLWIQTALISQNEHGLGTTVAPFSSRSLAVPSPYWPYWISCQILLLYNMGQDLSFLALWAKFMTHISFLKFLASPRTPWCGG